MWRDADGYRHETLTRRFTELAYERCCISAAKGVTESLALDTGRRGGRAASIGGRRSNVPITAASSSPLAT